LTERPFCDPEPSRRGSLNAHPGVAYQAGERVKAEIDKELLPRVNARRVDFVDNPRLAVQMQALERRVGCGGRDTIDHPPGGHDDVINAVAGAIVSGNAGQPYRIRTFGHGGAAAAPPWGKQAAYSS